MVYWDVITYEMSNEMRIPNEMALEGNLPSYPGQKGYNTPILHKLGEPTVAEIGTYFKKRLVERIDVFKPLH